MTTLKRNEIRSSLKTKGFVENNKKDHFYYYLKTKDGIDVGIRTKISRGSRYREICEPLIHEMARQTKIDKNQFINLVKCPLTKSEYFRILENKGLI